MRRPHISTRPAAATRIVIAAAAVLGLTGPLPFASSAAAASALTPGTTESFETISILPPEWPLVEYTKGLSTATIETGDGASGSHFLRLAAKQANHTRLVLPATVEPDATYRFSAEVRATADKAVPAVLAVDGNVDVISESVPGDGKWHKRDLYLKTGSATTTNLLLSFGWYGQTVAGAADYDRVSLTKVDAAPAGARVAGAPAATPDPAVAATTPAAAGSGRRKAMLPLAAVLLVLIAGCAGVFLRGERVG